jgi:hypothetical protein
MHLDGGFLQAILDEEGGDLGTLISLKLDDLSHFLIVYKSAVASEFLSRFIKTIDRLIYKTVDILTFLKAFRSFLGSYSIAKLLQTLKKLWGKESETYVLVTPARWSKSSYHCVVGCEYEYNRQWSQRQHCLQAGRLRQQRDLTSAVSLSTVDHKISYRSP